MWAGCRKGRMLVGREGQVHSSLGLSTCTALDEDVTLWGPFDKELAPWTMLAHVVCLS
jgi:hypothetical protein